MPIKNYPFWITALIGVALDHATKFWIVSNFKLGETWPLWAGVFHLTYVTNTGAAFSLFSGGSGWLRWLSLFASLGLMALALFGPMLSRGEQIGYGLILSGALGNGIDRFVSGKVVDFLDVRLINFAVFNLADVFINVGIICILISLFKSPAKPSGTRS